MSEKPPDYDLTPDEPRPTRPQPAPTPPAGTPAGATPSSQGAVPTGFIPPTPIILGPDDKDPDQLDAEDNRVVAILGYLVFLLPLIFAPKSKFARFHANQALLVFCCGASLMFVFVTSLIAYEVIRKLSLASLDSAMWFGTFCFCVPVTLALLVGVAGLALQGIINAANGEMNPLPVVGKIKLIKPNRS